MKLYDARIHLGQDQKLSYIQSSDQVSIQGMLNKYHITKALLLPFPSSWYDFQVGNETVFQAAEKDSRLTPCPLVIPDSGLEVGNEMEFIKRLIQRGARCAAFFPKTFNTTLDERVISPLLKAMEHYHLPMALFETSLIEAAALADKYPRVPFILHGIGYRTRILIPILKHTVNLHLSIAPNFAPYRGLEVLVEHCGAEKFIFASGYPESEPGSAIGFLLYSGLDRVEIEKIAFANLEHLIAGIHLEARGSKKHIPASPMPGNNVPKKSAEGLQDYVWQRQPLPWKGIVDMHAHYGRFLSFPIWGGDAEDLVAEMDRAGVEKMMVSHQAVMTPNPSSTVTRVKSSNC